MKAAIVSCNLGNYEGSTLAPWPDLIVPPGVELSIHRLTDADLPPRPLAMTSRLMCGIPKWFGHDFAPEAEAIIWIDASCSPTPIAVEWFLEKLGRADIAVFRHPNRRTVRDEYEFMKARMARPGETYLNSRYRGEWLDRMWADRFSEKYSGAPHLPLYASTAFAYRYSQHAQGALNEVFLWKARYVLHDQFFFSKMLHCHLLDVNVIPDNYLKCPALTFTRTGQRRSA